jgi:hypothetical protein
MRYYEIQIDGQTLFTSFKNGQNLRGALMVELDIPISSEANPAKAMASVRVWGVPLSLIKQSKDFNFKKIKVFGGFKKGLPLANQAQAGLLVQGYIFQAYGNWQGNLMSLDLIIAAGDPPATGKPTPNITMNWTKGQSIGDAIKTTLQGAFPGFTVTPNIQASLVAAEDTPGYFTDMLAFGKYIKAVTKSMVNKDGYNGVDILLTENKFSIFDQPNKNNKTISFKDLIGQPTWLQAPTISFKCAMRSDVTVGDTVTMPPSIVTNSQQAQTSLINQQAAFQGKFQIASVRHVGSSRQPSADSWVTVFEANPTNIQGA